MKETVTHDFISLIKLIPEIDTEYAIDAIGGSESIYEKLLMRIIDMIPLNIEKMDNVILAGGALGDFAVKVHGVKNSLRQAGYRRLALDAEALEIAAKAGEAAYCAEHYESFRKDMMHFYKQVNIAASQSKGSDPEIKNDHERSISAFFDTLTKAEALAGAYDTISAYELLLPLAKYNFGGDADRLIAKAMKALDVFKPKKAQEYITELIARQKNGGSYE